MNEEFYKDSKTDIVEQLNESNGTHITPENITLGTYNGSRAVLGDGVKYREGGALTITPRELIKLFGGSPVIVTDMDIDSGNLKVKDFIPLVNEYTGSNISVSDITNAEHSIKVTPAGGPAVFVKFAGNSVSLTGDFDIVLVKQTFDLAAWLTTASNNAITYTGAINNRTYTFEMNRTHAASIVADDYSLTNLLAMSSGGLTTYSFGPLSLLVLDDDDKLALTWPAGFSWIEPDVRDFTNTKKQYLILTLDSGKTFKVLRIKEDDTWESLLYKIQGRSLDSKQLEFLMDGHNQFLANNTGQIVNPKTDHFVINQLGVLVNNRHFTYNTRQEGQPDSDATTEGQSILIVGFIEAYKSAIKRGDNTRAADYLAKAKKYFASYISAFYAGVAAPDVPGRWQANWIVNGKAPVLAHYPLAASTDFPTHGGFIDIPIEFEDGVGQIPSGAPHWGEYLDVVGKAYTGKMGWQRIDATPYLLDNAGGLDWKSKGTVYPIDYICTWSFEKISGDGDNLGIVGDVTAKGTVALKDKTFNGTLNLSFAVRLPVEHGGYLLATNECQHNRPLQVPVNNLFRGNASDAEQWFCEAAYDLWKITGDDDYKKAFLASRWTIMEYTGIDSNDKFFRNVKGDTRYDTDGISYYYTYPSSQPVTFGRDANGNITIRSDRADGLQITMEQNAIPFRVNRDSVLLITYGGKDDNGGAVNMRSQLELSIDKSDAAKKTYTIPLTATASDDMTVLKIPIGSLVEVTPTDVFELLYASNVSWSENCTIAQKFEENVMDGRTAPVMGITGTADGDLQLSVSLSKAITVTSVVYKSAIDMNIRIIDADGWRWWAMMDASATWRQVDYTDASWTLSGYQTNPDETPRPSAVNWGTGVDEVTFLPDGSSAAGDVVEVYSLNGMPTTYAVDDGYTMLFNITFYLDAPGTVLLGDCTIQGQRLDPLPYTPGIIPFSNNSVPDAPTFDSWRGQPYPGYQYPFFYPYQTLEENPNRDIMIQNVIDFWYDSQQWYNQQFGVLGPGASAYVWDRWDMPDGETPNTWTMYHFGDSVAWSGYQPRAFYGAVRMYEALQDAGLTISSKLTDYITNWLTFLSDYVKTNAMVPTDYPPTSKPVPIANDFTGHMSGLYLAGISKAWMLGIRIPGHYTLAKAVYDEIVVNYVQRPGYPDKMNGSWSPFADPANDGKDGMFFGFWAGEIMRGLSLYEEYVTQL
jgi:hypothetical protein